MPRSVTPERPRRDPRPFSLQPKGGSICSGLTRASVHSCSAAQQAAMKWLSAPARSLPSSARQRRRALALPRIDTKGRRQVRHVRVWRKFTFSDPFGLCPPDDSNEDDCQNGKNGQQRASYCPVGSRGSPPNCTSVASPGVRSPGSCPNVSAEEWELGQRAIEATGDTEEGFLVRLDGAIESASGPGWRKTDRSIGPAGQWPADAATFVHSHPSGRGISPGDIGVAESTGIRVVSAGVGTNRYGSASRGGTPVTCNMPSRPGQ